MNDRYQDEGPKGTTRKSAASAKPKSKAAASVHIQSSTKTPQERKAEQKARRKAERAKQNELDRKYYNPPTAEYKRLRRLWWVVLIAAVLMVALSWFARSWEPAWISYVTLGSSYVLIILAFYLDFSKTPQVPPQVPDGNGIPEHQGKPPRREGEARSRARGGKAEGRRCCGGCRGAD